MQNGSMNTIIIKQYKYEITISIEGCTKIRDEIVTFFDSDNVIGAELKTPRKRTNSALSSTPNSVERQNKQTRIVSPPV
jgi:hypothetical protein